MPNKWYRKGANWERVVKKRMEDTGWVVYRSAGSHGTFDLCCLKRDRKPILIACRIRDRFSNEEKRNMAIEADKVNAIADIAFPVFGVNSKARGNVMLLPV